MDGKKLHTAIRYGLTQAFLSAAAVSQSLTMAEVVRKEYNIKDRVYESVPVFTQSGDDRYANVDKMIIKEADVLPHALINHVETKLGKNGEILYKYINWLRNRIETYKPSADYNPILHIDVYGVIGIAFNNDIDRMVDYLITLENIAAPFKLRIEGPVDAGNKEDTIYYLKKIREELEKKGSKT